MKQERAVITFELILNLLFVSLITTGATQFIFSMLKYSKSIASQGNDYRSEAILKNWVQRLADNIDTHRLNIPPRIHLNGLITFTDGSPYETSIHLDRQSNAITSLKIDALKVLDVIHCSISNSSARLRACMRHTARFQASEYSSYLGIDAEKISSWTGQVRGNGRCRFIELHPVKSFVVPHVPTHEACLIHTVIPVRSQETLYLSDQHELRLLKTAGNRTLENQPLPSELKVVQFSLLQPIENLIFGIEVKYQLSNSKSRSFQMFHHLGRVPIFNLLLNS